MHPHKPKPQNDSLFSLDYKIPYSSTSSWQSQVQQSQQQLNFIKYKLTEAYQKLQNQIKCNTNLQEQNQSLMEKLGEVQEKYLCEKKENNKLKETLEVVIKNRRMMQEEIQENKEQISKKEAQAKMKIQGLNSQMNSMKKELANMTTQCKSLVQELQEKNKALQQAQLLLQRNRQQSIDRQQLHQKDIFYQHKIQLLQQQITKITEEKVIEVNRLRHQLSLQQRSTSPLVSHILVKQPKPQRKRQFSSSMMVQKPNQYATKASEQQSDINKQNCGSFQLNQISNSSRQDSQISKWKRPQNPKKVQQPSPPPTSVLTDDMLLTQYQQTRKKVQQQLCGYQKIKRPSQNERQKMNRLQRQLYHLDGDIAGLKRKIRNKY